MANNRNIALDIAKGFGILLVIVGHTVGLKHICHELIYCFHMPLFFIIAGYLYHRQDIKSLLVKSAKRLLLPWMVTLLMLIAICFLTGNKTEAWGFMQGVLFPDGSRWDNLLWPGIHSSGAIWFLPALFWCRIIYTMIEQRLGKKSMLVTVPLTIIAILLGRFVLNLLLAIQVGCSALVFYEFGYRARCMNVLEKKVPWWSVVLFVPIWIFYERYVTVNMFWYQYGWTYPIDVLIACTMTFIVVRVSDYLSRVSGVSDVLAWIGKNSLYILCIHTLMMLVLGYASAWLPTNGWLVMLINMSVSVLLAMVYVKVKERVVCQR